MAADARELIGGSRWQCAPGMPGDEAAPRDGWLNAKVPGTVAGALAAAGLAWDGQQLDEREWWFRTAVEVPAELIDADAVLEFDGLATSADIWVDGEAVAQSHSMFTRTAVHVRLTERVELLIRFHRLADQFVAQRPRPRWRVARLQDPGLRSVRTSLQGRLRGMPPVPPIVGPWRPVRLTPRVDVVIADVAIQASAQPDAGVVDVRFSVSGLERDAPVRVRVGSDGDWVDARLDGSQDGGVHASAHLVVPAPRRWWPWVAGEQHLYAVEVDVAGRVRPLGRCGFRTMAVDQSNGGFRVVVNRQPLFVGGVCWTLPDPVTANPTRAELRDALWQVRAAGLTMVRVTGETVWESDDFYELCDELGLLVWQDCMLAFSDPPRDEGWLTALARELDENLGRLSGHPCLAVVSGGTEIAQQASYAGIEHPADQPVLTGALAQRVRATLGEIPFVPTSPWGGDVLTRPDTGVSHYYGVGAYRRPLTDARLAAPRFSAESLAFANPPERQTVVAHFGSAAPAGHDPGWKRGVFRDAGASWDFEDVRDHYVRELFGVDPAAVRASDPERYLDLGRAAVARIFAASFAEWRRTDSPTAGALVYYLRDTAPGAGLGIVDVDGVPKSPWYALRRALAPCAVAIVDEGLNGLVAWVHNSTPAPLGASLRAELFVRGELRVDSVSIPLAMQAHSSRAIGLDGLFDGFRDIAWAHRFGPLEYDVVSVEIVDNDDGRSRASAVHLPGGPARPREVEVGLEAVVIGGDEAAGSVTARVSTRRFAQLVSIDVPGWVPSDSWFDLAPGHAVTVELQRTRAGARLSGAVRALNGESISIRTESS